MSDADSPSDTQPRGRDSSEDHEEHAPDGSPREEREDPDERREEASGDHVPDVDSEESEETSEPDAAVEGSENDEEDDAPEPPPSPDDAERALRRRPDDVSGKYQAQESFHSLESGQTVGGRFTVDRYLGGSGGATSYLCEDDARGQWVVLKMLEIEEPDPAFLDSMRETIREVSQIRHPNLTSILGMGATEEGHPFVAMEYIKGSTLSQTIAACREKGHAIELAEGFHVLSHITKALEAIHAETYHGVLTPYNIYLEGTGTLKISNLGFGRKVASLMTQRGRGGAFADSLYVAPEAREGGEASLGPASDLYSFAMIAGELYAPRGLPNDREGAEHKLRHAIEHQSEALRDLFDQCLASDPEARPSSIAHVREELEMSLESIGVDLTAPLPDEGLPVEPAFETDDGSEDPFELPSLETPEETEEERYLIRRDGLDYGPFTKDEVLEQLYEDEIDEHTEVRDRQTQTRSELGDMENFREEVEEYIPIREERKRKERERREEIQRRVKQGGKALLVAGIVAALGVLGVMGYYYFTRPAPQSVAFDEAIASMDYRFSPPPTDFQTVSVDKDVLQSIFNPDVSEDALARKVRRARGGGGGSGGSAGGGTPEEGGSTQGGSDESEANVVDMSSKGSGSEVRLTDRKINNIILSRFDALRECILKRRRKDPSFSGVTVKFYIRPSGTTGGVGLQESQYENQPVGRCLIREFRTMKFPDPKAVTKRGVTFPLEVR